MTTYFEGSDGNGRTKHITPTPTYYSPYRIECVTVCAGYGDILAATLPRNLHKVDTMLIVTEPEDKTTRKVCEYYRIPHLLTDVIETRWDDFKKGKAINQGLSKLDKNAWILHLDADIVLPPNFRESLGIANLATDCLYGCDRLECKSYRDWQRFVDSPEPIIAGNDYLIHTTHSPFSIATRVQMPQSGGYIPIGFFQLWHADSKVVTYPEGHTDAGREDSIFAMQWPRAKRHLIPEVLCYHLESEAAIMGVNWKTRKTKPFAHE